MRSVNDAFYVIGSLRSSLPRLDFRVCLRLCHIEKLLDKQALSSDVMKVSGSGATASVFIFCFVHLNVIVSIMCATAAYVGLLFLTGFFRQRNAADS
jgi:hypothetical protein